MRERALDSPARACPPRTAGPQNRSAAERRPLEERELLRNARAPQDLKGRRSGRRRRTLRERDAQGRDGPAAADRERRAHEAEGAAFGRRASIGRGMGEDALAPRRSTEETPPRQRGAMRRVAGARGRNTGILDS